MDKKRQDGYVAGFLCLLFSLILGILAANNAWNVSGQILWVLTIAFGALGFGSLWKPEVIGGVATEILRRLSEGGRGEKLDSHNVQVQENSSGAVQAMATQGASLTINMDSKGLEVYSPIHTMIIRVNKQVPRETALQLTVGAWVSTSLIDFSTISALFNQHSDKFRDEDLEMWLEIENEIKTQKGFWLDKKRQEWFDYLESKYNSLRTNREQ